MTSWLPLVSSPVNFNFIFCKNIQSQTEKSQNSLTPALHHGYCTFTVHHGTNFFSAFVEAYINQVFAFRCENGGVFSLTSGKLVKDLRPELQPTLNQEQKRSVLFVTRQSIFRAWATNVQRFWTNFFRGVFSSSLMLPRLVVLHCVVYCVLLFLLFCCVVLCCVVICLSGFLYLRCMTRRNYWKDGELFSQLDQFDNGLTNSTTCNQRKPKNTGSV